MLLLLLLTLGTSFYEEPKMTAKILPLLILYNEVKITEPTKSPKKNPIEIKTEN